MRKRTSEAVESTTSSYNQSASADFALLAWGLQPQTMRYAPGAVARRNANPQKTTGVLKTPVISVL